MEFESLLGVGGGHNGLYAESAAVLEELLGSAARIDWGTCVISGDRKESQGVLWTDQSAMDMDCGTKRKPGPGTQRGGRRLKEVGDVPQAQWEGRPQHGHWDRGEDLGWM